MEVKLYSVYDKVACVYHSPRPYVNDAHAQREMGYLFNQEQSSVKASPQDFSVCQVGVFDDIKGEIRSVEKRKVFEASIFFKDIKNERTDPKISKA